MQADAYSNRFLHARVASGKIFSYSLLYLEYVRDAFNYDWIEGTTHWRGDKITTIVGVDKWP